MKEAIAVKTARGYVAQVVLSRSRIEPTCVRTLGGFYHSEAEAIEAATASITAPPKNPPTPTKAAVRAEAALDGMAKQTTANQATPKKRRKK